MPFGPNFCVQKLIGPSFPNKLLGFKPGLLTWFRFFIKCVEGDEAEEEEYETYKTRKTLPGRGA